MSTLSQRIFAAFLVLLILGAGFVCGWFANQQYSLSKKPAWLRRGSMNRHLYRMQRRLKLTPQQYKKILKVFDKHRPAYRAIKRKIRPELRKIRAQIRKEFLVYLTKEQQKEYQKYREERRARRKARRLRRKQRKSKKLGTGTQ